MRASLTVRSNESAGSGLQGQRAPSVGYRKLFDVSIQHGYYNRRADHACPDFDVYVNARTALLMSNLGMLFRSDAASFSVLYNADRVAGLTHFLSQQTNSLSRSSTSPDAPDAPDAPGLWTYLSFFLAVRNPRFMNVTQDIPHPLQHNLYFRNDSYALDPSGMIRLLPSRLPIVPARFPITVPRGGRAILKNAAGAIKQTIFDDPKQIETELEFDTGTPTTTSFYVDLSQLFEGRYMLEGTRTGPTDFIYTIDRPAPLCYIHILLNQPLPAMAGIYPIQLPEPGDAALSPDDLGTAPRYLLSFAARETTWVYYIVPRSAGTLVESDLQIKSAGNGPTPTTFTGPTRVALPTGATAYQFIAATTLPILERSDVALQLVGKGGHVLVKRLPVASADQVLDKTLWAPEPPQPGAAFSDIYVYV